MKLCKQPCAISSSSEVGHHHDSMTNPEKYIQYPRGAPQKAVGKSFFLEGLRCSWISHISMSRICVRGCRSKVLRK